MDKLFLIDLERNLTKTYSEFFRDLQNKTFLHPIIRVSNPYEVFLSITRSLLAGVTVDLLDSDLSDSEINRLGITDKDLSEQLELERIHVPDFETFKEYLLLGSKTWKIGLYTSGTTGRPKKVYHSFSSLTRNVKVGPKYTDNIWAFAYNPTHVAGVQVFFQALMNQNSIVFVFDLEKQKIPFVLENYKVTNISATPTFYRTILPLFEKPVETVYRVTLGGEKFDPGLEVALRKVFPNAKIVNIYASTEAGTLLSTDGEFFSIPEGKERYFKIAEDGELLVHKEYLGESTDIILDGEWYHIGDIVEFTEDGRIRFVGRKNEMINVGGYKVNPNEVEEEIKKIDGVVDAYVYARKNQLTGNILVAEVVLRDKENSTQEMEKIIYEKLRTSLQNWKIPRIIKFVDEIKLTRTGKKVRQ
ncbi:ANL family adenylate-forming protein [Fervidobacterium sp.]